MAARFYYGEMWNDWLRFVRDEMSEDEARRRFENGPPPDAGPILSVVYGENLETSFERADRAHDNGENLPLPEYALDINPRWGEHEDTLLIMANFFDELGRLRIVYTWVDIGGRMFLDNVCSWTHPDDGAYHDMDEATLIEDIRFSLDGTSHEYIDDKSEPMIRTIDRDQVDLTAHFEPVPAFGDWHRFGILRRKPPGNTAEHAG